MLFNRYGQRVSERDHHPYPDAHFACELGHKDINLVLDTANKSHVSMPFANILHDRFLRAMASGHDKLDWSVIGMHSTLDVTGSIPEMKKQSD